MASRPPLPCTLLDCATLLACCSPPLLSSLLVTHPSRVRLWRQKEKAKEKAKEDAAKMRDFERREKEQKQKVRITKGAAPSRHRRLLHSFSLSEQPSACTRPPHAPRRRHKRRRRRSRRRRNAPTPLLPAPSRAPLPRVANQAGPDPGQDPPRSRLVPARALAHGDGRVRAQAATVRRPAAAGQRRRRRPRTLRRSRRSPSASTPC